MKNESKNITRDTLIEMAEFYFDLLASYFPVMCASDEFHFLPRVEKAKLYYGKLDNFDADVIEGCISNLKSFQHDLDRLSRQKECSALYHSDLEAMIDIELLKSSVSGILIELENKQSWRNNPLLYLKIAFIGLDHALTKPGGEADVILERVHSRMHAIPRLFKQAAQNITAIPEPYRDAAFNMLADCRSYLDAINGIFIQGRIEGLSDWSDQVRTALDSFGNFIMAIPSISVHQTHVQELEATLRDHFMTERSMVEVFHLGIEEWHQNREQLKRIQSRIDPDKSWSELYETYLPADIEKSDTISLYKQEFERLYLFFSEHGFNDIDFNSSLEICETPAYLRSIRGPASFSAAFSREEGEKDLFFITTQNSPKGTAPIVKKRLHREYKFLTAHETIPGHHLLDSFRRGLENPVRRQIESPLFYEGWAYYAESLLIDYGYVKSSIEHLIHAKRGLWRAARCQIDAGLITGMINREDACALLVTAGFTTDEANNQINRFLLNPGYQLCYSLGRHEIMQLKEGFGTNKGPEVFHRCILEGGELPFHLIAKRFEKMSME
jgi:hypothetical protein